MILEKGNPVSVRYNGYELDNKSKMEQNHFFTMDYLVLNCKGIPDVDLIDQLEFFPNEYGNKIFKYMGTVVYKGITAGTLSFVPRSNIIADDLTQFQIENALFYLMPLEQLREFIKEILTRLNIEFNAVNRMDLAIDFNGLKNDAKQLLTGISVGDFRVSGREKALKFFARTVNGVLTYDGVHVGKRSSSRFLRIYDKSREQSEKPKTYIQDAWKKTGLCENVWRYEYQLNARWFSEHENVNFENIFNADFLYSMFMRAQKSHFEIKYNTGKKEVNKEKDFMFLDFAKIGEMLNRLQVVITKVVRNINQSIVGQKRLIKGLLRSYFSTNQNADYISPIGSITNDYYLNKWLREKLPFYIDEFVKKQIVKTVEVNKLNKDLYRWT